MVLLAQGAADHVITIKSGSTTLGTQKLSAGFNSVVVSGMTTGVVSVVVTESGSSTTVVSGTGPIAVRSSGVCNYNFQVVGLS